MVLPIIDEDKRRASMVRCPEFEGCDAPLCPLDPYLKLNVWIPDAAPCLWFEGWYEGLPLAQIPPVVLDRLPIYLIILHINGALVPIDTQKTG